MADIFISYARDDRAKAEILAAALEREDFSVWWDPNIAPGETWDEVIERELAAAKCVVVLWSSTSIRKHWVKVEATEALNRRILVPALIESVVPPLAFRPIEAADLTDWRGQSSHKEYNQLRAAIRGLTGPSPQEIEGAAKRKAEEEAARRKAEAEAEVKRKAEAPHQQKPTPPTPVRRTWMVFAAVAVFVVGGIVSAVYFDWARSPPPQPEGKTPSKTAAVATTESSEVERPSETDDVATEPEEPVIEATSTDSGFEVEDMDATYIVTKTSNVRAEPTAQSDRLGRLSRDSGVNVTGKVKDKNWYRIAFEGGPAYVYSSLLQPIDAAELSGWQRIMSSDDPKSFESFLRSHPNGHFAESAQQRLLALAPMVDEAAASSTDRATTSAPRRYDPVKTFKDCEVCPEMVVIPAGSFMMGSPPDEEGHNDDEEPQHRVTIAKPFAIGKYEVTFAEWDACFEGGGCRGYRYWPDDEDWGRGRRPVINVSWQDAQAYLSWLSEKTGKDYRLPSEAEWEYAARAGTTTRYSFGENITPNDANFGKNVGKTTEVGSYPANAWGLFDMHGNVWEWVEDVWHDNYEGAPTDGSAWANGKRNNYKGLRVLRGGSWRHTSTTLDSASRNWQPFTTQHWTIGFRLSRTLTP